MTGTLNTPREPMRRQSLYDLVWSVPVSRLAPFFEMSDRGFSKHCGRENIPLPPRGYWAKLAAGRSVTRTPLPPLGPNGREWTWIAPTGSTYGAGGREWLRQEIPGWGGSEPDEHAPPTPPEFDFDMHVVAYEALSRLGNARVRAAELQASRHAETQRRLDRDKAASETWSRGGVTLFRGKRPRRRLSFLNALLLAVQRLGGNGKLDDYGREIEFSFGRRPVPCSLETRFRKPKGGNERLEVLVFRIMPRSVFADQFRFEDDRTGRIEGSLRQICCSLVLVAEFERRAERMEQYRHRLQMFEEELQDAERLRRERRETAHTRLLSQARAHHDAEDIRRFVAAARRAKGTESLEFATWQRWALARADAIDPLAGATLDLSLPDGGACQDRSSD